MDIVYFVSQFKLVMQSKRSKDIVFSVRVSPACKRLIKILAATHETSTGELIERSVDAFVVASGDLSVQPRSQAGLTGTLINTAKACELTNYSARTLEAYRRIDSGKDLVEGIHWQRGEGNRIQWSLEALDHWYRHRNNPIAHREWCEARLGEKWGK